jgi:cytochrome oxidase Cu insertion factor (SCO1/SenC/PrrC family)
MKRIRLEFDLFRTNSKSTEDVHLASPSPIKGIPRTPQRPNATVVSAVRKVKSSANSFAQSREAQARMDEMRQLIGKRYGPTTPRTPQRNTVETPKRTSTAEYSPFDDFAHSIEDYVFDADGNLAKALAAQDELQADVKAISASLKEVRLT